MNEVLYGATQEEWNIFNNVLALTQDILPVVSNPRATVSPKSSLNSLGKVPSLYNSHHQVVGIPKWTEKRSTPEEVEAWSKEPDYGICIQSRTIRAFDIDVEDPEKAEAIKAAIHKELDWLELPIRSRCNSGKILLAFRLKGEIGKRRMAVDGGIIELLADGQQWIAAGTHPSGVRYDWQWPDDGEPDIHEISTEQFEKVWKALEEQFAISTAEISNSKRKNEAYIDYYDPRVPFIKSHPLFLREGPDRQLFIECPFKAEHTGDSGDTETAYFPKGTRGYNAGNFVCMHAHCRGKFNSAFDSALGYYASDFDVLPERSSIEKFRLWSTHEIFDRPKASWFIKDVIPAAALGVVYGESGSGKSFFIFDMVMSVVRGVPWRGKNTKQGYVAYVCAEGQGGFVNRVSAYMQYHNLSHEDTAGLKIILDRPNLLQDDHKILIERINESGKFDIVVIDTLAQATSGGDENNAKDMGKALSHCYSIHENTGALVILVHHSGKDESKGARGWSGLKAAADFEIKILRKGDKRQGVITKSKDGADGNKFPFVLKTVVIGTDDDGGMLTSCVADEEVMSFSLDEKVSLGKWEKLIVSVLDEAGGHKCKREGIITHIMTKTAAESDPGKRDRRGDLIKQAMDTLQEKRWIEIKGDEVLLTSPIPI